MSLQLDIEGRVAVITGAGGGIGRCVAEHLAEAGAVVAALDLDLEAARRTLAGLRPAEPHAGAFQVDVASAERTVAVAERILAEQGRIDILVNAAGIYPHDELEAMAPDDWQRVIDVNLTGAYHCCRAVLPAMVARGFGRMINLASGHALGGGVGVAHYAASKSGLLGLTRALARELGPRGIRVNVICPTLTDTSMPRQHLSQAYLDQRAAANPCGRIGRPEDIAMGVVYLSSRWADYVNGHTLLITGGDFMQ